MPSQKADYVMVADLERFQHYKTRCPPWVKIYWSLLDDPRFMDLNEVDRYRYIMCVLIASRVENRIKNDPVYLSKMMRISEPVDLTPLISSGLLLAWRKRDASAMQAKCYSEKSQRERRVREREELERETKQRGSVRGSVFTKGMQVGMEPVGSSVGSVLDGVLSRSEREVMERYPHLREGA